MSSTINPCMYDQGIVTHIAAVHAVQQQQCGRKKNAWAAVAAALSKCRQTRAAHATLLHSNLASQLQQTVQAMCWHAHVPQA
jgi:hypothetical protein